MFSNINVKILNLNCFKIKIKKCEGSYKSIKCISIKNTRFIIKSGSITEKSWVEIMFVSRTNC